MDLQSFDLNLLVVLDTLLSERSVSKAARRLNLSQPAVSAALNRLRAALNDPILVREGMKMVPTPQAERLAISVREILVNIEAALTYPVAFDPTVVQRKFRIAAKDYSAFLLIPELMRRVSAIAPNIDIEIWDTGQHIEQRLKNGDVDIAITDAWELRSCKRTEVLFRETFTCLARQQHPRIHDQLTLAQYTQEQHALISVRGVVTGNVDVALKKEGLTRQVRLTLPHILSAPAVIASTDLIITMATRIANRVANEYPLKTFAPPIELKGFDIAMAWHSRFDNDAALQWLQNNIRQTAESICRQNP